MSEEAKRHGASTPAVVRARKAIRAIVPLAIIVAIVVGVGPGTLCSVGYDAIAYICPLGALESLFGAGAWAPRALIALAIVVAVTLVVGKAFCSWVCPVPPLSDFLSSKKRRQADSAKRAEAGKRAVGGVSWRLRKLFRLCGARCRGRRGIERNRAKAKKEGSRHQARWSPRGSGGRSWLVAPLRVPGILPGLPYWVDVRDRHSDQPARRVQRADDWLAGLSGNHRLGADGSAQMVPSVLPNRRSSFARVEV